MFACVSPTFPENTILPYLFIISPQQMADVVSQPVLFNPSEQNSYMVSRVDINPANAITSSNDGYPQQSSPIHNAYNKRPREESLLDNNGNILEPSASPSAKKPFLMTNRNSQRQDHGKDSSSCLLGLCVLSVCYQNCLKNQVI